MLQCYSSVDIASSTTSSQHSRIDINFFLSLQVQIKYFDSIPLTNAICVLKTGFLFAASEFGNHALYQFQGIGLDDDDPICTSSHPHKAQALVRIFEKVCPLLRRRFI